ncbi:MAG: hypothetical protein IJ274_14825 [Lachnospiraceae bacterium]|nr:hypothetical protein [Lachnospiraceae bacterium]
MNDYVVLFMVIGVVVEIIGAIAGIAQKSARTAKPGNHFIDCSGMSAEELYDQGLLDQELLRQQMEQDNLQMNLLMQEQQQQQQFMDLSLKSVTPFEMGGFDTSFGNSFNDFDNFNNGGMF